RPLAARARARRVGARQAGAGGGRRRLGTPRAHVVDEARLAEACRGEHHQLAGRGRRHAEVGGVTYAEIVGAEAGALEGTEAGALDAAQVRFTGAQAAGGGRERRIDRGRERALGSGEVLIARAHGEAVGLAQRWGGDDLDRHAQVRGHAADDRELLEVL